MEADSETENEHDTRKGPQPDQYVSLSFPQRLMEVLEDKNYEEVISWAAGDVDAFIIHKKDLFTKHVLPKHFNKATKFASFARKLNRWGFQRVQKGQFVGAYFHQFFRKGNYKLLLRMDCKTRGCDSSDCSSSSQNMDSMTRAQSVAHPTSTFPQDPGTCTPRSLSHNSGDDMRLGPRNSIVNATHSDKTLIPRISTDGNQMDQNLTTTPSALPMDQQWQAILTIWQQRSTSVDPVLSKLSERQPHNHPPQELLAQSQSWSPLISQEHNQPGGHQQQQEILITLLKTISGERPAHQDESGYSTNGAPPLMPAGFAASPSHENVFLPRQSDSSVPRRNVTGRNDGITPAPNSVGQTDPVVLRKIIAALQAALQGTNESEPAQPPEYPQAALQGTNESEPAQPPEYPQNPMGFQTQITEAHSRAPPFQPHLVPPVASSLHGQAVINATLFGGLNSLNGNMRTVIPQVLDESFNNSNLAKLQQALVNQQVDLNKFGRREQHSFRDYASSDATSPSPVDSIGNSIMRPDAPPQQTDSSILLLNPPFLQNLLQASIQRGNSIDNARPPITAQETGRVVRTSADHAENGDDRKLPSRS